MSDQPARSGCGVAITGHRLPLDAILRLAQDADRLGYDVLVIDGDTTWLPRRPTSPIHDSTALLAATLRSTERIRVASIRVPVFWNAALLARSFASLQTLSAGRTFGFLAAGQARHESSLGLPELSDAERLSWLDELLEVLPELLSDKEVSFAGRHIRLDGARLGSAPVPLSLVVAAARPRALRIVDRHADIWEANVPPVRERLDALRQHLTRPLPTWIWIFARPGLGAAAAIEEYRRHAPWFRELPEAAAERAVLWGEVERCRERLLELRQALEIDLPILDLAGLDESAARSALEAFAPAKNGRIS